MSELVVSMDKDDYKKDMMHYRRALGFLEANVPIQCLCLPSSLESALLKGGYARVTDLLGTDLTKIKGVGDKRLALLAARLNEFLSVGI